MLDIRPYKQYNGEKRIAVMDNSLLAFMHELKHKGYSPESLFSDYEDYKFGRKEGSFDETYELIENADLLIIDDLGTEVSNPVSIQFFFDIINKRTALSKKMIISTNLTMDGILKKYTDRLFSRLYESFEILHFMGEDIRIQKLKKEGYKND